MSIDTATEIYAKLTTDAYVSVPDHEKLLDEIIDEHKEQEVKRSRDTKPDHEAVSICHIELAPESLLPSLRIVAAHFNVSRATLTKCASHQIVSWYESILGGISNEFEELYAQIHKAGGKCSPLRQQMDSVGRFQFRAKEPTSNSINSIRWVMARLAELGRPISARAETMLLVGLTWSLTTLRHREWDEHNITNLFIPEVANLMLFIEDARDDIYVYRRKFDRRVNVSSVLLNE